MIFFLTSCRQEKTGTIVARVGNAELTREEALEHIDTTGQSVERELGAYIESWINSELIYQEALRTELDRSESVVRRLGDVNRQIVNQAFFDHFISSDSVTISDQTLFDYYEAHTSEFLAREYLAKLNIAIFPTRERASAFTAAFLKAANWEAVISDSVFAPSVVRVFPPHYYSEHTLYPPELWKIASTLSLNDISFPVKTQLGYAVLQLVGVLREGKPSPFELVHDELRTRMLIEARQRRYEELLGTLRKQFAVKIFTGPSLPSDTLEQTRHE